MNRQRNLTWIEKKQIEKIAFDHPFFDTHGTVLSKNEAKAIIHSAEMRKSGTEIVTEACDRAGVPRPDFVDNHYTVFENLKEVIAIPAIRRIGIIAIALILLIVFFAATPTGRAIAERVIQYIATLFDDGRVVVNQSDKETTMVPLDTAPDSEGDKILEQENSDVFVNTFEDFTTAMGVQPTVLPFQHTELCYNYNEFNNYLVLHTEYETPKGKIITFQIWNAADMALTTLNGFTICDADSSIYYSFEDNGSINVMKLYEDSVFGIVAENNYTLEEIISLLTVE
jgi:hypothetical protein